MITAVQVFVRHNVISKTAKKAVVKISPEIESNRHQHNNLKKEKNYNVVTNPSSRPFLNVPVYIRPSGHLTTPLEHRHHQPIIIFQVLRSFKKTHNSSSSGLLSMGFPWDPSALIRGFLESTVFVECVWSCPWNGRICSLRYSCRRRYPIMPHSTKCLLHCLLYRSQPLCLEIRTSLFN